jgi:hypothetical protein
MMTVDIFEIMHVCDCRLHLKQKICLNLCFVYLRESLGWARINLPSPPKKTNVRTGWKKESVFDSGRGWRRQRNNLREICWISIHETFNWNLQNGGFLHKIKSSQILRVLLSSIDSISVTKWNGYRIPSPGVSGRGGSWSPISSYSSTAT